MNEEISLAHYCFVTLHFLVRVLTCTAYNLDIRSVFCLMKYPF